MKTYLECLSEAAALIGKPNISADIKLQFEDEHYEVMQAAADMYAELSNSHKHSVVRGAVTSHCLSLKDECEFTNTCPECTKPATEPLPAEGEEKPCVDGHWFATEYMGQRPARCIVCGHMEI